jgi:hypothetical protein
LIAKTTLKIKLATGGGAAISLKTGHNRRFEKMENVQTEKVISKD